MAISDVYTGRSSSVSMNTGAAFFLMSLNGATTIRGWVVGVRVELGTTTAAAGNNVLFQLCRPANTPATPSAGSTTSVAHDFSAPSSIVTTAGSWTTTPTVGSILWEQQVPQTTGSAWEEFPPLGYEWQIPAIAAGSANCGVHAFGTASVSTSTPAYVDLIFSE